MERGKRRNPEHFPDVNRSPGRQIIIAVNQKVLKFIFFAVCQKILDICGHVRKQFVFADKFQRACGKPDDAYVFSDFVNLRGFWGRPPRINIDGPAKTGKRAAKLVDIDIFSAAFNTAQRCQRVCVISKYCNAFHHMYILSYHILSMRSPAKKLYCAKKTSDNSIFKEKKYLMKTVLL